MLDEVLLEVFESSLRAVGAPIVKHREPGLDDAAIDELIVPLDLQLPDEARVWWRWHNGTVPDTPGRERCIMPGRDLLSPPDRVGWCAGSLGGPSRAAGHHVP